jgi:hypothetical protein
MAFKSLYNPPADVGLRDPMKVGDASRDVRQPIGNPTNTGVENHGVWQEVMRLDAA